MYKGSETPGQLSLLTPEMQAGIGSVAIAESQNEVQLLAELPLFLEDGDAKIVYRDKHGDTIYEAPNGYRFPETIPGENGERIAHPLLTTADHILQTMVMKPATITAQRNNSKVREATLQQAKYDALQAAMRARLSLTGGEIPESKRFEYENMAITLLGLAEYKGDQGRYAYSVSQHRRMLRNTDTDLGDPKSALRVR